MGSPHPIRVDTTTNPEMVRGAPREGQKRLNQGRVTEIRLAALAPCFRCEMSYLPRMASRGCALGAGEGLHQLQPRLARAFGAGVGAGACSGRHGTSCRTRPIRDASEAGLAALVHGAVAARKCPLRPHHLYEYVSRPRRELGRIRRGARRVLGRRANSIQYIYEEKGNERFIPVLLGDTPDEAVPFPLRPHNRYRVKAFALSDPGYEDLYRELTGQPAILRPAIGEVVSLPPRAPTRKTEPQPAASPVDVARIDKYAPAELIGRETETAVIEAAWAKACNGEPHPFVLTFVALGGEGRLRSSAKWANDLAARGLAGLRGRRSPGRSTARARASRSAPRRTCFSPRRSKFSAPRRSKARAATRRASGSRRSSAAKRALLILDGLEPLQYPPTSPLAGQSKDDGVLAVLRGLAQRNAGLCLVDNALHDRQSEGRPGRRRPGAADREAGNPAETE